MSRSNLEYAVSHEYFWHNRLKLKCFVVYYSCLTIIEKALSTQEQVRNQYFQKPDNNSFYQ
mgnify:CR=1 FL=1